MGNDNHHRMQMENEWKARDTADELKRVKEILVATMLHLESNSLEAPYETRVWWAEHQTSERARIDEEKAKRSLEEEQRKQREVSNRLNLKAEIERLQGALAASEQGE